MKSIMFYINRRPMLSYGEIAEYWLGYRDRCVCYAYEFYPNGKFYGIARIYSLHNMKNVYFFNMSTNWYELLIDKFVSKTYTQYALNIVNTVLYKMSKKTEQVRRALEKIEHIANGL